MKRYCLLFLLLYAFFGAMAQSISVKSFKAMPMDLTASSLEGKRIDQNGDVAALIKVVTNATGFVFEGGTLGIVDTKQETGEVWVWVPRASRKITIKHPKLGVLRSYVYPVEIEAERTYEMVLTTAKMETVFVDEVNEQFLMFRITPHDALLEVNEQVWPVSDDGIARKLVDFGSYTYRVQAQNYHPYAGVVEVNDPDETQIVTINLEPDYGWIAVAGDGNLQGASVFVDNAYIGRAPCKSEAVKSGKHVVRIVKEMYSTYSETVTVTDNETLNLAPELSADFAHVTLEVDADAEIWVNDEKKGVRTWSGDLPSGTYRIECKQSNHESTSTKMEITKQMNGQVIRLDAPLPFKGSLVVESKPDMADLYIDNEYVGQTPKLINDIVVGQHVLRLTKEGYKEYAGHVLIKKNERTQVEPKLEALPKPKPKKEEKPKKPKPVPVNDSIKTQVEKSIWFATANAAYSLAPQASFGFSVGQVKRFGWFFSAMSNFGFKAMQYNYTADANGYVDGEYPYYTGEKCSLRISVMGGAMMKVAEPLYLRAGMGYGQRVKSWYTKDGQLVKMSDDSWTGVDVSLGAQLHLKGFVISLEAVTTSFKDVEAKVGVGYAF
jgi:hypothetical protein